MDKQLREALVGDWARGLPPGQLEDAIVAAGLAEHVVAERHRWGQSKLDAAALLNEVRMKAVQALDEDQYIRWQWPNLDIIDVLEAKAAYAAITRLQLRVAIQTPPPEWSASDRLQQVVQTLARPSRGITLFVEADTLGGLDYCLVNWPLRIGFAADLHTRAVREALAGVFRHQELIEVVDRGLCEVLVVGAPMSELLDEAIDFDTGTDTDPYRGPALVVAVGDVDIKSSAADALARSIISETRSGGVHLCACGSIAGAAWLNQFVEHLSHNEPVDRALSAADEWLYGVGFSLLNPDTVETMRLSFIVEQIEQWFRSHSGLVIEMPESIRSRLLDFPPVRQTSGEIADYLRTHAEQFRYDSESEEATGIAGIVRSAGGFPSEVIWGAGPPGVQRPDSVNERGPRRLGADVIVDGRVMERAFVADVPNLVRVTIGRTATHQTEVGIPEPDFEDKDEVDLPVWARVGEDVHHGTITLPADKSEDAKKPFEFDVVPIAGEKMSIDIVVYQPDGNGVLQAALLSGAIVDSVAAEAAAGKTVSLVVVDVKALVGEPTTLPKDSIVHSGSGMLMKSTGDPIPIPVNASAVRQWIAGTVKGIEKGAIAEEQLDTPIDRVIVTLAGRGSIQLVNLGKLQPLRNSPRIQVVSLEGTEVFPVDFFYSGPTPNPDASLCDAWETSLKNGTCEVHGPNGPTNGSTVCPLQFWSMSKVIEHHGPIDGANTPFSAIGFRGVESGSIGPLAPVIVGVSELVLEEEPEALESLATELGAVSAAANWDEWKNLIGEQSPGLLIAMPHQDPTGAFGMPTLELGGQDQPTFGQDHVTIGSRSPGPVMLLLGCDTAVGQGAALASFASVFSGSGASHVISSLGEVIAVQAPKAAAAFMHALAEVLEEPNASLGEALLKTKRVLLADHKLLPLMLVSHGDTDWGVN